MSCSFLSQTFPLARSFSQLILYAFVVPCRTFPQGCLLTVATYNSLSLSQLLTIIQFDLLCGLKVN
jgi:hypothetical protein